ncbi:type I restriction modification DNA specificity domain protein [Collimonas arenae]|uniref:Type I restriction modification DNA specificity domain protein n=2 Tax=Collimonas arenae TaxID=279058 RepID=A0A127PJI3_9BURK|nr:type I restriction modification DNA specificity domain protein [Collimonas arenae]AMP07831.1 type I restriction modification DNA specificity domain protein [Collimonas arenae]
MYLKSKFAYLRQTATGATIPHINRNALESIPLPVIDFEDQIRVAHLLGKIEALITQRKHHLQQLDDLLQSLFLEMFSPKAPGYTDWPLVEIKDLAAKHKGAMRTGPFGSNLLHSEFTTDGDVAVLGIDNAVQNRFAWDERRYISRKKYQELENYRIYPDDVIVTIMGTIGRSAVIPDDIPLAINTKHLAAITLNREIASPLFLSYSIHSNPFILNQFKSKNRGAIMSGLNLGLIKETKLKRPPIDLQNDFAAAHKLIDKMKSRYQESLTDLESLYGALSQQAFKGELDLSRVPLASEQTHLSHEQQAQAERSTSPKQPTTPSELVNELVQAAQPAADARNELLARWLKQYLTNMSPDANLGSAQFLESAWQLVQAIQLETDGATPALTLDDYDELKDLIFEKLRAGDLIQIFDIHSNRVELQKRPTDCGT